MRLCSVSGCDRKHYAKGFCHAHWLRERRGRPAHTPLRRYAKDECSTDGCDGIHYSRGMCERCYRRDYDRRRRPKRARIHARR